MKKSRSPRKGTGVWTGSLGFPVALGQTCQLNDRLEYGLNGFIYGLIATVGGWKGSGMREEGGSRVLGDCHSVEFMRVAGLDA